MKSNRFLTVLLAGLCLPAISPDVDAQFKWQVQNPPTGLNLVSVSFTDTEHGWIAAADGTVFSTENGGMNWQKAAQLEYITPTRIFFINENLGWLSGNYNEVIDSATIYRTTDGGSNWERVFHQPHFNLNDVFFINDTMGWMAGSELSESDTLSLIMYTINGGTNWTMCWGPRVHDNLFAIHFRDTIYGQACGHDGLFFTTNNGGRNEIIGWAMNISIPSYAKDLYGIFNGGSDYGCAVGEDGIMLFTKDKWSNHLDYYNSSGDTLLAVSGSSDGIRYWAAGRNGCIATLRYSIFMVMVSEEERVTGNDLNDIHVIDESHIWAVGDHGTILYYNDNNPPVAVDDEATVPQNSTVEIHVLDNDQDPDLDELSIYSFTGGNHGSVEHPGGTGYLLYDPDDDYTGYDTLQYVVSDGQGGSDSAAVYIEVTGEMLGPFEPISVNFDSVAFGNAIWGDVDNDSDLDILVCGEKADGTRITSLYINDAGSYRKAMADLEGLSPRNDRAMAFTDLDNDGRLDFIITGENNEGVAVTDLYLYDEVFYYEKYETVVPGVMEGSVDWGDYDNDGDPDLLISGETEASGEICEIYRNDGISDVANTWTFTPSNSNFWPLKESIARFVDFNGDDYLDVVSMGTDPDHKIQGYYYTNSEGLYVVGRLDGHANGSVEFCDFDADGNLELLVTGDTSFAGPNPVSSLLTYDGGTFSEMEAGLENVSLSSAAWGDYDNDGDYDLLLSGTDDQLSTFMALYENQDGTLVNSGIDLPGMASGTVEWGDYDNDGDLDILLSGYFTESPHRYTTVYRNHPVQGNTVPLPPQNITVEQNGTLTHISWDAATDNETPAGGLTYQVELTRKNTGIPVLVPPVNEDGSLKITRYGNAFNHSILISGLEEGGLYLCRVQTLDAGFRVSDPAEFEFNVPSEYFLEQDFAVPITGVISAAWMDADDDRDLDLMVAGQDDEDFFTRLYPVSDRVLDKQYLVLDSGYFNRQVSIMDLNNDNILDLSYGFAHDSAIRITVTGYGDTLVKTVFKQGNFDWGDFDNDGDEDLLVNGMMNDGTYTSELFRNQEGILEKYNILISGVLYGDLQWVDFDTDGDLDIALCGSNGEEGLVTKIYENHGGAFLDTEMDLPGLKFSDMDFADYDDDGDLDLLICGATEDDGPVSKVYRNENNVFVPTSIGLVPVWQGACKWADLNNDGIEDIILCGNTDPEMFSDHYSTRIYLSGDGGYTEALTLPGYINPVIAPGDYNNDFRLDLFIAGQYGPGSKGILYKNVNPASGVTNYCPSNIVVYPYGDSAKVVWWRAVDPLQIAGRQTFNMRVGTTPGGSEVMSAKADGRLRKVSEPGNLWLDTCYVIHGLSPDRVYYLAVQAVNAALLGSPFTDEMAFNTVSGCFIPDQIIATDHAITNAAWVDYDGDDDLDLMVRKLNDSGSSPGIYRNDEGEIDTSVLELESISFTDELSVNDFDCDNDPDLLLLPKYQDGQTSMLENAGGIFQAFDPGIQGLSNSISTWGDFDNDGDEDLVIMGTNSQVTELLTNLYRNDRGSFSLYSNLLVTVYGGDIKWVDLDNDGDMDLVRCGCTKILDPGPEDYAFIVGENHRGVFIDRRPDLPGLVFSNMDFGDFDNDGDLDMLYSGGSPETGLPHTYICTNTGGTFTITDSVTGVFAGTCKWLDTDNDGFLDILLAGYNDDLSNYGLSGINSVAEVFRNTGLGFVKIASLEAFLKPVLALGDYDKDGRADLFLGGQKTGSRLSGIIYRNSNSLGSDAPDFPHTYAAEVYKDSVHITWHQGYGFESRKICFNLRIGTTPGGCDVLSPLSNGEGYRKTVGIGNMQLSTSFTLLDFEPSTTYYYSVQSINKVFAGSKWAVERSFVTFPTGTEEPAFNENMVRIFPNPARDVLNLEFELKGPLTVQIELYGGTGKRLMAKQWRGTPGINKTTLSIPEEGIFILKLVTKDQIICKKIIRIE